MRVFPEYVPALQVLQAEDEVDPVFGLYFPAGQLVQEEALPVEYVPAPQVLQPDCPEFG